MKLAYFDCFSGISGDMTVGALLDAGCDLEVLREGLRGLPVPGWELQVSVFRRASGDLGTGRNLTCMLVARRTGFLPAS